MEWTVGIEGLTNPRKSVRRNYLSVLSFFLYSFQVSCPPYLSTSPDSFSGPVCRLSQRFGGVFFCVIRCRVAG